MSSLSLGKNQIFRKRAPISISFWLHKEGALLFLSNATVMGLHGGFQWVKNGWGALRGFPLESKEAALLIYWGLILAESGPAEEQVL